MKVKVIKTTENDYKIESQINDFIKPDNIKVIDIKLSIAPNNQTIIIIMYEIIC
jgi:hypothetical protein